MKRLTAFSLAFVVAGCASEMPKMPEPALAQPVAPVECTPVQADPAPPSPLLAWQAYQASLLTAGRQVMADKLAAAEKDYAEKPTGEAVLRLAITLAASNQPPRQERAQRLFSNLRLDPRLKTEEQQFAAAQAYHLNELRLMRQERVRLEQRLAQEQQAKDALDEKIRALTTIELKMNERQRSEKPAETPATDVKSETGTAQAESTEKPATLVTPKESKPENKASESSGATTPKPAASETKPSKTDTAPTTEKPVAKPKPVEPTTPKTESAIKENKPHADKADAASTKPGEQESKPVTPQSNTSVPKTQATENAEPKAVAPKPQAESTKSTEPQSKPAEPETTPPVPEVKPSAPANPPAVGTSASPAPKSTETVQPATTEPKPTSEPGSDKPEQPRQPLDEPKPATKP